MLVTLKEALDHAEKHNYAVGMFGCYCEEMIRAIVEAGEESHSPVILGFGEGHIKYNKIHLEDISHLMINYAKRASIPVVVHLDHGFTYENVVRAIHCDFSSVMIDASSASYEENVRLCAEISRIAHAVGCSVEAEIGHVGGNEDSNPDAEEDDQYTVPEDAARFAEATGVDALAVAIGTAHGTYKKVPRLDLNRLEEIYSKVGVPLVLHGGSGLSTEAFRATIDRGVRKINVYTDLSNAGCKGAADYLADSNAEPGSMISLTERMIAEIKKKVIRYTEIFRSAGQS